MYEEIKLPHPEITPQAQSEIERMGFHVYKTPYGLRVAGNTEEGPVDLGAGLFCALADKIARSKEATP